MNILISVFSVIFLVLCVLLIIIILLQSDKGAGMGILGGSSQSAFGSSTADVITKITTVMVAIFMLGSLGLAIMESRRATSLEKNLLKVEDMKSEKADKDVSPGMKSAEKDEENKTRPIDNKK